jgi:hypothetical protein
MQHFLQRTCFTSGDLDELTPAPSLATTDSHFSLAKVANQIKTVPATRMPRLRQSLESAVASDDVAGAAEHEQAASPRPEGLLLRWA